jgi:hypothetical protein
VAGFFRYTILEAADRDIGLVAVLLPEQPFVHLGGGERILRNEIAAAREIADDGVGLRQRAAVVEFDRRHLPGVIELEEFRGARLTLERIDRNPAVGQREFVANPFHFEAIARIGIAIDLHRRDTPFWTGAASDQPCRFLSSVAFVLRVTLDQNL